MIGGDFQIMDALKNNNNYDCKIHALIGSGDFVFTDTGRSALAIALEDIKLKYSFRKALLPVYICKSIINTFIFYGFEINYYSMGDGLNSPEFLPEKIRETVVFINHYFGFKNKKLLNYVGRQQEVTDKIVVINDLTQTCLSKEFQGMQGYSIHSLRKFLPVPDGGVLVGDNVKSYACASVDETFISKKIFSKLLRQLNSDETVYLRMDRDAESIIDSKVVPRKVSAFTKLLLKRIDISEVQEKRVRNWNVLSKKIKAFCLDDVKPVFDKLEIGEVPLGFPIITKKRDELREFLSSHEIYCPIHWVLEESVDKKYKKDTWLSKNILTIPIDQRLAKKDLDKIIDVMKNFYLNK